MNMQEEQVLAIDNALRRYGAHLDESTACIAKGAKVTGVRVEIQKKRLRFVSANTGQLFASFPASKIASGVSEFVQKFWYWEPES